MAKKVEMGVGNNLHRLARKRGNRLHLGLDLEAASKRLAYLKLFLLRQASDRDLLMHLYFKAKILSCIKDNILSTSCGSV